jgi:Outer membrane protein beta-barrel domain
MHKASTLIGLTLVALGAGARAEESAPAAPAPAAVIVPVPAVPAPAAAVADPFPPAPPQSPPTKWRIGLSFLPMGLGKFTTPIDAEPIQGDASFAYGFGLSASFRIIAGFSVGVAPQIISNVNYKVYPGALATPSAVRETDLMARLAYTFPIVETIGLYVAVLPGYSIIGLAGTSANGLVLAFEGGVDMGITDRIFANFGGGYQLGFQSVNDVEGKFDARTRYVRVNLGGGVRF